MRADAERSRTRLAPLPFLRQLAARAAAFALPQATFDVGSQVLVLAPLMIRTGRERTQEAPFGTVPGRTWIVLLELDDAEDRMIGDHSESTSVKRWVAPSNRTVIVLPLAPWRFLSRTISTVTAPVGPGRTFRSRLITLSQPQIVFEHSLDHVYAVVRAVRTWSLPSGHELAFVRERAALRATQHVPLSALLHSYRLGHRTVWERLVQLLAGLDNILDASLALTTLTLSYTELISGVLAEGYVERQNQLFVQIDRDQRDLLEDVLRGTFERLVNSPRLTSTFALVLGVDFLVLVVHTCLTESGPPAGEALTRAAETLKRHFALGVAQPFVVVRHAEIISIAPVARARPAAIAHFARQALAELEQHGERWVAGVSTVCAGLAEVARGYQEARLAADSAPADGGVYALLERRVSNYLVERADGTALRMVPPAARRWFDSLDPDDQVLVRGQDTPDLRRC